MLLSAQKTFENNLEILEKNPLLSHDIKLHEDYEFNLSKLKNDWQWKQIEGYQTRIITQPRLEPG